MRAFAATIAPLATACALLLAACAGAPRPADRLDQTTTLTPAEPASVGMSADLGARLDSIVTAALAEGAAPGAVLAVGRWGRLVHLRGYGTMDTAAGAPAMTDSTIFDMASLTKVVAATTAAMILEEEGLLDLDRPLREYLPELDSPEKAGITVRMVLAHNAGFVPYAPLWRTARGREEYLAAINAGPLAYTPGDTTIYSDWDLILTGLIIERLTGKPLDVFLEERVWGPLGMHDTGFNPLASAPPGPGEDCTATYDPDHPLLARIAPTEVDTVYRNTHVHGIVHDENACALGGVAGHAGLFSSARDLAVFAQMMLNG